MLTNVTGFLLRHKMNFQLKSVKISSNIQSANKECYSQKGVISNVIHSSSSNVSTLFLWIITGLISYGHKLPVISSLVVELLYLRIHRYSPWWKILANIRKAFVVFNAIIGILTILSTIDEEISIANIVNIFNAYLAKVKTYGSSVLNWILDTTPILQLPPPPLPLRRKIK